jgi:hypothetical protein
MIQVGIWSSFALFFAFMLVYAIKIYFFNQTIQTIDVDLYKELRVRLLSLNKPFTKYIFKKGFKTSENTEIIQLCKPIYYVGWAMQWSFNTCIALSVINYVLHS